MAQSALYKASAADQCRQCHRVRLSHPWQEDQLPLQQQ